MKNTFIWISTTILLYILLATAVMFSREATLQGVRAVDFKIYIEAISKFDRQNLEEKFKDIANILTANNRKIVYFPLSFLDERECFNNGLKTSFICNKYTNSNEIITKIKSLEPRYLNDKTAIYNIDDNDYIYYKFTDDTVLIGETGDQLDSGSIRPLYTFMKNKWVDYFLSWEGQSNRQDGFTKTWEKTEGIFLIISLVSSFLYILNKIQLKKYHLQYLASKEKEKELKNTLNNLSTKYNNIKNERYDNDEKIKELEIELNSLESKSETDKKKLQNTISELKSTQDELNRLIEDEEDLIEKLEDEGIKLRKTLNNQMSKLDKYEQEKYKNDTFDKLEKLVLLWRHDLTWQERKETESLVALKNSHLPFTITQAFIAFEDLVEKILIDNNKQLGNDLDSNIKRICNFDLIAYKNHRHYDSVRKARNKWFHKGIHPGIETINFLIEILEEANADIFI